MPGLALVAALPSDCQGPPTVPASVLASAGVEALPSGCQEQPKALASVLAWAGVGALPSDCQELPTVLGSSLAQKVVYRGDSKVCQAYQWRHPPRLLGLTTCSKGLIWPRESRQQRFRQPLSRQRLRRRPQPLQPQ